MLTRVRNTLFAGAAVFALAACEGTTTAPQQPALTVSDMAGVYTATEAGWTSAADAGMQYDLVGAGGTYEMAILEDGTYTTRVHREGFEDITTTGRLALDNQGAMTITHNGVSRGIDYTFENNRLTWTDAGAEWDFGHGAGMEGARFNGTFQRQ
jgi:hypothetical protein